MLASNNNRAQPYRATTTDRKARRPHLTVVRGSAVEVTGTSRRATLSAVNTTLANLAKIRELTTTLKEVKEVMQETRRQVVIGTLDEARHPTLIMDVNGVMNSVELSLAILLDEITLTRKAQNDRAQQDGFTAHTISQSVDRPAAPRQVFPTT